MAQPCHGILYNVEKELRAEIPNKGVSSVHCAEGREPNTDGTFLGIHLQKVLEQFTLIRGMENRIMVQSLREMKKYCGGKEMLHITFCLGGFSRGCVCQTYKHVTQDIFMDYKLQFSQKILDGC